MLSGFHCSPCSNTTATGMACTCVFSLDVWTKKVSLLATSNMLPVLRTSAVSSVLPVRNQMHLLITRLFDRRAVERRTC